MVKIQKICCLLICIIVLSASFVMRSSIKDTYNMESEREQLLVPYLPKDCISMCSKLYKTLLDSPIIIVGKATGESKYVYRNFWQSVVVSDVIKGKDIISKNEVIKITGCGKIGYQYDKNYRDKEKAGKTYVDTNFLDYMRKGDEYLIFISEKVNLSFDEVYALNPRAITMRYINLTRDESWVCTADEKSEDACDILYKKVKGSEFVTNSDAVLKKLSRIKKNLIKDVYQKAYRNTPVSID